jgi:ABC-type sugar transport system substrate-binding protein
MAITVGRRQFISVLGGATVAWPLAARAQQRAVPVIGFVSIATREASLQASWYQAFHDGMRDLGWEPGRNLLIEYSFADNKPDRLAALVQDLVRLNPDVIFVPTRPALPAVKEAVPVSLDARELNDNAIDRRNTCNAGRRNYRSSMREDYSAVPKTVFPRLRR